MNRDPLRERAELSRLLAKSPRAKNQVNSLFASDVEILRMGPGRYVVSSTDSIGEEISTGLYREPFTWGWMTVMASVSDLAASGASPLGLLLSTQWGFKANAFDKKKFFAGVNAALRASGVSLIGGDTGASRDSVFGATILGESRERPLERGPLRAGDIVAIAGRKRTGLGPALAYRLLFGIDDTALRERSFRPAPDWKIAKKWRSHLRAAIDTSDGIASSLVILASLNNVGFEIDWRPRETLHPQARAFCRRHGLPEELLWIGDHGDFQTMVVIPERASSILAKEKSLVPIARVTKKAGRFEWRADVRTMNLPLEEITRCPRDFAALQALVKDFTLRFTASYGN